MESLDRLLLKTFVEVGGKSDFIRGDDRFWKVAFGDLLTGLKSKCPRGIEDLGFSVPGGQFQQWIVKRRTR